MRTEHLDMEVIMQRLSLLCTFVLSLLFVSKVRADNQIPFQIIASTGNLGLVNIHREISLNDLGNVAFIGQIYDNGGAGPLIENVFLCGDSGVRNVTPGINSSFYQTFSPGIQMNNNNWIVVRRYLAQPSPLGIIPITYVEVWDGNQVNVRNTRVYGENLYGDFDGLYSYPSMNNAVSMDVVFSALDGNTNFLGTLTAPYGGIIIGLGSSELPRPMFSDDYTFVSRFFSNSIRLYRADFQLQKRIADSTNGFGSPGRMPGLSDNGRIAAFYAEPVASTTDTTGLGTGDGIFVAIKSDSIWAYRRIAGRRQNGNLDPGEIYSDANRNCMFDADERDDGPIAQFLPDERVCVGSSGNVTFMAIGADNKKSVYVSRIDLSQNIPYVFAPTRIASVGSTLDGQLASPIVDLQIFDSANSNNRVALWAKLANGLECILRATIPTTATCIWGAAVRVTLNNQTVRDDYLVALDRDKIILKGDLTIDSLTGEVLVRNTIPLNTVTSITLLADPNNLGFNKYVVGGASDTHNADGKTIVSYPYRAIELRSDVAAYDGRWHYRIRSVGLGDDLQPQDQPIWFCFALPKCSGNNVSSAQIKGMLTNAAAQRDIDGDGVAATGIKIPPHVLYAISWHEGDPAHRWQHYVDGVTLITRDGGLGLGQISVGSILYDSNPNWPDSTPAQEGGHPVAPCDTLSHIYRLASEVSYNIEAKARVLYKKTRASKPIIGTGPDAIIEQWFYLVWSYNGWSRIAQGNPCGGASLFYPAIIYKYLRHEFTCAAAPPFPQIAGSAAEVENLLIPASGLPITNRQTPNVANVDIDFDGNVDATIRSITPVAGQNQLALRVSGTGLGAVTARRMGVKNPPTYTLISDGAGTYRVQNLPVAFQAGTSYQFEFFVTVKEKPVRVFYTFSL